MRLEFLVAAAALAAIQTEAPDSILPLSASSYDPAEQPMVPSYAPRLNVNVSIPLRRDWRSDRRYSPAQYRRTIRTGHTYILR